MDPASRAMDVEKSSLCNCVVNFLLQENYILTAFELFHELVEDGRDDQAIRLREFFADSSRFPPDRISRLNTLRVADPQSLLEEKESLEKNLAISDYELRLAQEDLSRLKLELQKTVEATHDISTGNTADIGANAAIANRQEKREASFNLGPLKDAERRDLNCAVKEYLLLAGYKLTAMTFYEEVTDQNLDVLPKSPACISDALRHYYYQYLSCTDEAAEEKMSLLQERESLLKGNEQLTAVIQSIQKGKDLSDGKLTMLTKSFEATQKDLKDRDVLVQDLKQTVELQRKELNECRSEITSLKMHIESSRASKRLNSEDVEEAQPLQVNNCKEEIISLQTEIEGLKEKNETVCNTMISGTSLETGGKHESVTSIPQSIESVSGASNVGEKTCDEKSNQDYLNRNPVDENNGFYNGKEYQPVIDDGILVHSPLNPHSSIVSDKVGLATINTLSEALPKIVPYVLINHREELLPLMMCAIEHHPDSDVRDSLTHTLFNLIKRPDEQQRRIIMDACVSLAKNVGEMRTETELLPQCWEQINHKYEERRLLVAQSCGELAEFVPPEIRDSLILSIVQQLVEDSATVVREAAAHNLALLLPLFPNLDKYFKVEELLFQLVCDPSGLVVETTLKELMPAVLSWGNKLDHILRVLRSHILGSAQRCPPVSGVEGSVDSHLRVLGERERWNIDVLLRMLSQLLPFIYQNAIDTCPFTSELTVMPPSNSDQSKSFFSTSMFELYAVGNIEWTAFDWMHVDCFPDLIQLSCLLTTKEDYLRDQITKFLLDVSASYGDDYLTDIMLPVFLLATGDDADLTFIPTASQSRIKGLRPKTAVAERLAMMCVLPLLLVGVLGAPRRQEQLADYMRKLLFQKVTKESSWSIYHMNDVIDAVRFLCSHKEHHATIFNILWEMVVSSNLEQKIFAANLLKVLVSHIDAKVASTHILPALVTLGSDQNLSVKYASIDAFGSVAQHFKNDMIIDKIRIQMDAFLEDGSHEATVAVIRALTVAVPHTMDRLRDYLLSKIFQLTSLPALGNDVMRRRERTNAFCEAIRALDATDLPVTSVRDYLLPSIQNLLKEADALLDPAHKEALEVILKERSGGTLEAISKAMGTHLSIASSVTSLFGESGRLSKKETGDMPEVVLSPQSTPPALQQEDTRFRRMIRGSFSDMFKKQAEEQ